MGVAPPRLVVGFQRTTEPFALCSSRVPEDPCCARALHGGVTARAVSAALVLSQALYPPHFPLASLYASAAPVPGADSVLFTAAPLIWHLTLTGTSSATSASVGAPVSHRPSLCCC